MYEGGGKGKTQPLPHYSLYKSANKSKEKTQEERTEANRWKGVFCFIGNGQTLDLCSPVCLSRGVFNDGFIIMTPIIRNNGHTSTLRFHSIASLKNPPHSYMEWAALFGFAPGRRAASPINSPAFAAWVN